MDEQALVNTLRRAEDVAQLHDATPASSMAAKKHKKHFKHCLRIVPKFKFNGWRTYLTNQLTFASLVRGHSTH